MCELAMDISGSSRASSCTSSSSSSSSEGRSSSCTSTMGRRSRSRRSYSAKLIFYVVLCSALMLGDLAEACGPGRGFGTKRSRRKLTPLVFKEHVPNVSENTLGASGLSEGKISKDDPAFRNLVPNYNRDIAFKDNEGTGADRVMSQRCKEKLNVLAWSVMQQWPGMKLRVTEAWDEDQMHGPDSLHYEGRAVDITTSDKDRSKYGMLARLAVEAGFDWVYYESRGYIHASVKSDSSQASHSSGCFSGSSTVLTESGERRLLSELRVGERVQSMNSEGKAVFSEVMMFMDRDVHQKREFVEIHTERSKITVTPAHLLLSTSLISSQNVQRREKFMFADRIQEGDYLLVNVNGTLRADRVRRVSATLSKGVYAPLTTEGTIIVDDVVASCYALVDSQFVAHLSFMPYRVYNVIRNWFGLGAGDASPSDQTRKREQEKNHVRVNSVEDNSIDRNLISKEDVLMKPIHKTSGGAGEGKEMAGVQNGIHWYAGALYSIKDAVLPSSWIYH